MKIFRLKILLLPWLLVLASGCEQDREIKPTGMQIPIGVVGPFSGENRSKGEAVLNGIRTASRFQPLLANSSGIRFVVRDDQDEPRRTIQAVTELASRQDIAAILVFSGSDAVLAIKPVVEQYRIPVLAIAATNPEVTKNSRFISRVHFNDQFQGTVAALFVRDELLIDSVAVFSNPDSAYSTYLAGEFIRTCEKAGGTITDHIRVTTESPEISRIVERVARHRPELLYLPLKASKVLAIVTAVRKQNWNPGLMGGDGLLVAMVSKQRKKVPLIEGMLATDIFGQDMPLTPLGEKMQRAYLRRHAPMTSYAMLAMDGYRILFHAMNRCPAPADRLCINKGIRSTVDLAVMTGNITIQADGNALRPLIINTIDDGKMRFRVKVY